MAADFSNHASLVQLEQELLIGRGGVRSVYHHPDDENKCIKILFNQAKRRAVTREETYLRRYWLAGKPFDHLSRFYGNCQTSLGVGGVFQLIRDYDGTISNPLPAFLPGNILADKVPPSELATLLRQLHDHLVAHSIIVSDPAPANIVITFMAPKQPKLVLIDGIGNPHFIKIADFHRQQAKKIIDKKWRYYIAANPMLVGIL